MKLRDLGLALLAVVWTLAGVAWWLRHDMVVPAPGMPAEYPAALASLPRSEWLPAWITVTGVLLFALAWPAVRRRLPVVGLVLAVAAAMAATHTLARGGKRGEVYGRMVSWLDDDMMISLRYARNLAEGHGLVWNSGERVEGFTNFLWTLCMAPAHWLVPVESVSFLIILGNTGLLLVLIVLLFRWVRACGGDGLAATLAALGLATSSAVLNWTVGGGEAVLLALLLLGMTLLALSPRVDRRSACLVGLLGGLAFLTRPDALVALAVLAAAAAWRRRGSWSWLAAMAGCLAALPLLQLAFRVAYYGEWLPNTYYLKATGWEGRSAAGLRYVVDLLPHYAPWLLFAAVAAWVRRELAVPWLAVLAHLAYLAWVGGDELPERRFLVPVLPLLLCGAFVGAGWVAERLRGAVGELALVVPVALFASAGLFGAVIPGTTPPSMAARSGAELRNVHLGYLLRENTEPDARIAHFWAGATAYFSDRPAIDLYGKCDPVIARLAAREAISAAGHNKYDFDHSLGRRPDVVVQLFAGRLMLNPGFLESNRASNYRAAVDLAEHPLFRAHYQANLVGAARETPPEVGLYSLNWHGVYVRDDTTRARPAPQWKTPTP